MSTEPPELDRPDRVRWSSLPMTAILLAHASQLLTLRGDTPRRAASMRELGIVYDGAVLIENGKISEIGRAHV